MARRVGYRMAQRVVTQSYVRTILGKAWLVLRPLVETVGMALIFGGILGATGSGDVPYFLFLLVGMAGWRAFERPLHWSIRGFDRYRRIGRSLRAPLLLFPLAAGAPGIIECAMYPVIMAGVAGFYLIADGTGYVVLGPGLLVAAAAGGVAFVFGQGFGMILSVLNARARDTRFIAGYVLVIWLFATPVIYQITDLPEGLQTVAQINPMTTIVELVKWGVFGTGGFTFGGIVWTLAAAIGSLGAGLWFLARYADRFVSAAHGQGDDESGEADG
jgi:lipopolysaccharide transport system permease protein